MNIAIWAFAGAALGWVTFSAMGWNEGRSKFVAIVIGVAGGIFGGKVLAPLFIDAPVPPNSDFAMMPLMIAVVVALVFLVAGDQIDKRWGG